MTNLQSMGSKVAFVAALGGAVAFWPAACGGRISSSASPSAGSAATPATLLPSPKSFLPGPGLAHAGTGQNGIAIADIAEKAAPSVVNVASSRTVKPVEMPFFNDPFFRHFFGPGGGGP